MTAALLLLSGMLAVAGCMPAPEARDGRTEVVYWHMWTGQWQKVVERIVARFNDSQDRIRVRPLVVTGDANTKFLLALAGGDPPDLMAQWNQVIPAWAAKGALVPLDTLMTPEEYGELREWLYPAARKIGTYEGHFYALAVSLNAFALLMNADMLREAGLDPDRPPRSTAELDEYASRLFRDGARGKLERAGFLPFSVNPSTGTAPAGIHHWGTVFGGEFYDPVSGRVTLNHPRLVAALEWMVSYTRRYDVNRIVSFQSGLTQQIGSTYPFIGKKIAMLCDGQWRIEDMRKYAPEMDYRVVPLPYPEGGREKACHVNGNFLVIPTGARHPREALEFARFWAGIENEAAAAEIATWGGWIPAGPSVTRQPAYQAYLRENPHFRTFLEVAGSPNVRTTPGIPVQSYLWERLAAAEEAALRLQKTPQQALDQATYEVQRELDKVLARSRRTARGTGGRADG